MASAAGEDDQKEATVSDSSARDQNLAAPLDWAAGGDILASNHPEGGAIFTVELPVAPTPVGR